MWTPYGLKRTVLCEGEYATGAQEHLYIENNGAIAAYSADEGLTVWGSLQCPFYVHKSLVEMTGLPEDKVRIDPGGDGRRVWRQGRLSVDDWSARGAAGDEIGTSGEDYLRPHGRHGGDHQAASFARAARTAVTSDGKLLAAEIEIVSRWRGLFNAVVDSAVAGDDSRGRTL